MARTTTSNVAKLKTPRVDPSHKRKFNGSDSSGSRSSYLQRSPGRKLKMEDTIQVQPTSGSKNSLRVGVITMEEEELYEAFQLGRKVGSGNWATVYEARNRADGQIKAVKMVSRCPNGVYTEASRQRFDALKKEYKILRTIPAHITWHVNVIRHDCFISTPLTGCLIAPLHDEPMTVCLPLDMLRSFCLKLASAVDWLHSHYICHNDIKLANIVVDRGPQNPLGEPILVDFGFATDHRPGSGTDFWTQDKMGTAEYLSPERAAGRLHDERLSDAWALGVSFFEMATGRTPFERPDEGPCTEDMMAEYRRRIRDEEWFIDEDLPPNLVELCRLMVHKTPRLRLPLAEVAHQDFFRRESRDNVSDFENQRHPSGQRVDSCVSFTDSSNDHRYIDDADPTVSSSQQPRTGEVSSLAFPPSPSLKLGDTSLEPDLLDSKAPWISSADLSLRTEESHKRIDKQTTHSVLRKAPNLRELVDLKIDSSSREFISTLEASSPLRLALHNASSRANAQPHSSNKLTSNGHKQGTEQIDSSTTSSKGSYLATRADPQGSPRPTRVLSPVSAQQPIHMVGKNASAISDINAMRSSEPRQTDRRSSVVSAMSSIGSFQDASDNDVSESSPPEAVRTLWSNAGVASIQSDQDRDSSFSVGVGSSCEGSEHDDDGGGDPTVILPTKITTRVSHREKENPVIPPWDGASVTNVTHEALSSPFASRTADLPRVRLLARLDEIERLIKETRKDLLEVSIQCHTSPKAVSRAGQPTETEQAPCSQDDHRAESRLSPLRQLVSPSLVEYDADCETDLGNDQESIIEKTSVAPSTSITSFSRETSPLPPEQRFDTNNGGDKCRNEKEDEDTVVDGPQWVVSSSSCSRLSVLCEDELEDVRQATPPQEEGLGESAASDLQHRSGSVTPRSIRSNNAAACNPLPTSAARSSVKKTSVFGFRAPTSAAARMSLQRGTDCTSDKENTFVLVNTGSLLNPSVITGGPTKLKRSFSNFRGRRLASQDDSIASSSSATASTATTATMGIGLGEAASTSLGSLRINTSHSRSKSATLSSLFSFSGQHHHHQYHVQQQRNERSVNVNANAAKEQVVTTNNTSAQQHINVKPSRTPSSLSGLQTSSTFTSPPPPSSKRPPPPAPAPLLLTPNGSKANNQSEKIMPIENGNEIKHPVRNLRAMGTTTTTTPGSGSGAGSARGLETGTTKMMSVSASIAYMGEVVPATTTTTGIQTPKESASLWKRLVPSKAIPQRTI